MDVLDHYRGHRRGEGVGSSTINREMATLKHALSKAVEWKLLRKAAREELTAIKKYQEPDGRLRYLSGEAEAERLLQACKAWLRPLVLTADRHAVMGASRFELGVGSNDVWLYTLEANEERESPSPAIQ